ncbi:hypothetical protein H1R20_g9944, partial [Candolleomyces eurysporus]
MLPSNWSRLPPCILVLVLALQVAALTPARRSIDPLIHASRVEKRSINQNPDGSHFIWLPQQEYSGQTFYDGFFFFNYPDPTNGHVNYVNESYARERRLVYVEDDGTVIMKADQETWLPRGQFRDSIRIESYARFDGGLFILDLAKAPWGCGTWPAFWTVGNDWPWNGEIDIIEGVHDNQHNQVAWHTAPGCRLDPSANFTGNIADGGGYQHLDCNSFINHNAGCGATEWSRASYGPLFDEQGGGVFVMKWDENSIAVWSFFRAAVPRDIDDGTPNPSEWGPPSANLSSTMCDIGRFFKNHAIIFDITFCGDWAGNSYATSGCPGTCDERLMDPNNFVEDTSLRNGREPQFRVAWAGF